LIEPLVDRIKVISMRAVAVSQYGASPTLMDLPDPRPGPGQVLIKTRAAGVNPVDQMIAHGAYATRGMDATFPLVMGVDVGGLVEAVGERTTRFTPGQEVFGQLFVPPLGSAGTYAERVAVAEDANLAPVPDGMGPATAAALPTAGGTALDIAERIGSLSGKTVLIVGAAGGVGSYLTQLVAGAGANVITVARASAADRMRSYGAGENIDRTGIAIPEAVRRAHPDGIDVLIDVASDADAFAAMASLVRRGGTALTTRHVADPGALTKAGVNGINFQVNMRPDLLTRLADYVMAGRVAVPPIKEVRLDDAPTLLSRPGATGDGKTVVVPS
jgi:NADPH2:quinone reductase